MDYALNATFSNAVFSQTSRDKYEVLAATRRGCLLHCNSMTQQLPSQIELLRAAYAAFNARDIDGALALMTPDVEWPKAFKGGFVRGPEAVRAYWSEQWSEINPRVEPISFATEDDGRITVKVHQVVRDLAGTVLADEHVGHRFTIEQDLFKKMEICELN